jgi:hypothetical protein
MSNNGNDRTADSLHGYPIDMIGNQIRKGDLVTLTFPSSSVICRVVGVSPVSLTDGMEIEGNLVLAVHLPHRGAVPMALVIKEPEEAKLSQGGSAAEIEALAAAQKIVKQ